MVMQNKAAEQSIAKFNLNLIKEYDIFPVFSLYVLECSKFIRKNPEKFVCVIKLRIAPEIARQITANSNYM
jgi:hypothetical protein